MPNRPCATACCHLSLACCRDCKEFDSESFDAVIDKGTLDALLCCGRGAYEAAARMTAQLHRCVTVLVIGSGRAAEEGRARCSCTRWFGWINGTIGGWAGGGCVCVGWQVCMARCCVAAPMVHHGIL